MRQTELHLSDEDRSTIDGIRGKGSHQSSIIYVLTY